MVDAKHENIGIMFGSFDPPHNGHTTKALEAKDKFQLKKVYLLPTPQSPTKILSNKSSFSQKIEMCKIISKPYNDWLITSDLAHEMSANPFICVRDIKRVIETFSNKNVYVVSGDDFKTKFSLAILAIDASNKIAKLSSPYIPIATADNFTKRIQHASQIFKSTHIPTMPRIPSISSTSIRNSFHQAHANNTQTFDNVEGCLPNQLITYINDNLLYM